MLENQHTSVVIPDTDGARKSSQIDLDQFYTAIKQTYFQLDKDLRKMVKDDSGCVCVSVKHCCGFEKRKIFKIFR